ncbi:MAG: hypothetical protein JXR03_12805 [Cyclobacteriaceae bacterium]
MKSASLTLLTLTFLFSCYPKIKIEGFEQEKWNQNIKSCDENKVAIADLIISQEDKLLSKGQAEIKQLLGQPDEHELYRRNQKFFHYHLTAGDSCSQIKTQRKLSILFDALDRSKELMITE